MDAPASAVGAHVACALVDGASTIVAARAGDPQKLLLLRPRGLAAVAVVTTYGGGLVAGDRLALDAAVHPGARLLLTTQTSTKVYRSATGSTAGQELDAAVGEGALLAVLPDPVCPFAEARYVQRQRIALAPSASLALLDWVSAGRTARGERWAFAGYESRTRIERDGRPLLIDQVRLEPGTSPVAERLGDSGCVALLVLFGPRCAAVSAGLLAQVQVRAISERPLVSASPVAEGLILRCAAADPEMLTGWLRPALAPLFPLIGHDPWQGRH